jgi:hypothetical protein
MKNIKIVIQKFMIHDKTSRISQQDDKLKS